MNSLLLIDISYGDIKINKMKSLFITLGMTIDIVVVVSPVSITGEVKNMIEGQFASLGANSL